MSDHDHSGAPVPRLDAGSRPDDAPRDQQGERPDLLPVHEGRRSLTSGTALLVLSAVFFVIGLILWPVPVATGVPFHLAGLLTMGMASRRVARTINRWERRLPERWSRPLHRAVHAVHARLARNADSERPVRR